MLLKMIEKIATYEGDGTLHDADKFDDVLESAAVDDEESPFAHETREVRRQHYAHLTHAIYDLKLMAEAPDGPDGRMRVTVHGARARELLERVRLWCLPEESAGERSPRAAAPRPVVDPSSHRVLDSEEVQRELASARGTPAWQTVAASLGIRVTQLDTLMQLVAYRLPDGQPVDAYQAAGLCGPDLVCALRRAADELEEKVRSLIPPAEARS